MVADGRGPQRKRVSSADAWCGGSAAQSGRGWTQRGWLEKKEGVTANWGRHWFQVEGTELHFYDNERSQGGSRLGVIDMKDCTIDHSTAVTADVGEIEIKANTRTYRIQCGTDVEAEEWIEALSAAKDGRVLKRPARSSESRPARSATAGRSATSSQSRRPGGKAPKHPWTQEEDEKLVSLIIQHGANHWAKIAQQIPGRVGKQCRERWQNHLNPDVNRAAEWSEDEEAALFKWHEILGNKWADIAKHLPGRTDNSVKNYFHKRVGQLKRGAPASRPKKSIEKSSIVKPSTCNNRALVAKLRQSSSSLDLAGASPTPPRTYKLGRSRSEDLSKLSAPERAQIALRARRNSMPAGTGSEATPPLNTSADTSTEPGGENIDVRSPPARTGSNSVRSRRRLVDSSVLKEKNELIARVADLPATKSDHVLQPSSSNVDSGSSCVDPSFYSPIPVSVCTQRVWGAPPPKVFRGPWMSGVNRTSLDALTMEVALPTPPRLDNQTANNSSGALIPCADDAEDHDDPDMMDASINSPGLALLGGAFGISPNPRTALANSGPDRMLMGMLPSGAGCGGAVESPMATVFYTPSLDRVYQH